MSKYWLSVVGLLISLTIVCAYIWHSTMVDQDGIVSHKAAFIGVSSEALKPLSKTDRNNVVLTSESGDELGLVQTRAVYFPSIERFGNSFILPDEDNLVVFDKQLKVVSKLNVPKLGVGILTNSDNSPNGRVATFYFNEGDSELNERHLMVLAEKDRVFSTYTQYEPVSVTACDDASVVWIEHFPQDSDNSGGPGSTRMMRATIAGDIAEYEIPYEAESGPSYHSSLGCLGEPSYVTYYTDNDLLIFKIKINEGKLEIIDRGRMPLPEAMQSGRFYHTSGSKYYVYGESGMLHRLDLENRSVDYSVEVLDYKHKKLSITIEDDTAFIVSAFEDFDFEQAVSLVDLNNPQCVSRPILLRGYDTPPKTIGDHLYSASFLGVDSILPIERNPKVNCA